VAPEIHPTARSWGQTWSVATGPLVAVRRPGSRWPVLVVLAVPLGCSTLLAVEGGVIAAVATTQRWVTASLVGGVAEGP